MYYDSRLWVLTVLYRIPLTKSWAYKRLPRHRSGYKHYWIDDKVNIAGMKQRIAALPAVDRNPTIVSLNRAIVKYHPQRVLEAGCGYGRLMKGLLLIKPTFSIEGCDLADELLEDARKDGLDVFKLDIVNPSEKWLTDNVGHWDIVYCRAVFMFLIDHPEDTRKAMQTLEKLASKKVIIWEWRHVCDYMRAIYPSSKFEYHSTPVWAG